MNENERQIDLSRLTPEQRDQLERYERDEQKLSALQDIALRSQEMSQFMRQEGQSRTTLVIDHVTSDEFARLFSELSESLDAFNKQEKEELPDYATPVVQAVKKLETQLKEALSKETPAPQVNVEAPEVNVEAPVIDLSAIEKTIGTIPAEFAKAIKQIPKVDIPKYPDRWNEVLEKLESIDTATRIKPQAPSSIKVLNTDGSNVTSNLDKLITYDKLTVGNAKSKFRDGFASPFVNGLPASGSWDVINQDSNTATPHIISRGGDAFGSSYLRISLSPFLEGSEVSFTSKDSFSFPMILGFGVSTSQRFSGQELFYGIVGVDSNNTVEYTTEFADLTLTGSATVTSNVATITYTDHGLKGGDRVNLTNAPEHRMNVGPVQVTILTKDTFTVPVTLGNGTYSVAGAMLKFVEPARFARNYAGMLLENTNVQQASQVARRNGAKFRSLNTTVASTSGSQTSSNPYTDAWNASNVTELGLKLDEFRYRSYTPDSTGGMSGLNKYSASSVPDEENRYKIQIRARNLTGITRPIARITSISKAGTTTATVTTDVPHGLATNDFVQIYGVRDITNFPNLTAQTAVLSTPTTTTFTITIGGAVTATSLNGTVFKNEGSVLSTAVNANIQSVQRTNGILTLTFNTPVSTPLSGEYWHVHGLDTPALALEGGYKILRSNTTTTIELEAPGQDMALTTTGGTLIKRTDMRIHFVRLIDHTRMLTEIIGGTGNTSDVNNSVPVAIVGGQSSVNQSTGTNSTQWNAAGYAGLLVNDSAASAITTNTTSGTIAPGQVTNVGANSHAFNVVVTAVSGTTPTLDVIVQESPDNGTNWRDIYHFERITANGSYTSPLIPNVAGTRYRYVQNVTGTTPSITRSINRIMHSVTTPYIARFFDRNININSAGSTTPVYAVGGANVIQGTLTLGAVTTTAPVITLEGSETGTGDWYPLGSSPTISGSAGSTVVNYIINVAPMFVRARVTTAGSGATLGYVSIKALGI